MLLLLFLCVMLHHCSIGRSTFRRVNRFVETSELLMHSQVWSIHLNSKFTFKSLLASVALRDVCDSRVRCRQTTGARARSLHTSSRLVLPHTRRLYYLVSICPEPDVASPLGVMHRLPALSSNPEVICCGRFRCCSRVLPITYRDVPTAAERTGMLCQCASILSPRWYLPAPPASLRWQAHRTSTCPAVRPHMLRSTTHGFILCLCAVIRGGSLTTWVRTAPSHTAAYVLAPRHFCRTDPASLPSIVLRLR
jgi:hypothetical protein